MSQYNPSVGHAIGVLILGIILGVIGVFWASSVFTVAWIVCIVIVAVILIMLAWKSAENFWWIVGGAAEKLDKMQADRFECLGISLPKIRVKWTGSRAIQYYDDTDVPLVYFVRFMHGSDKKQVFPVRNCRNDWLPEWSWEQIRKNLEVHGFVIKDSAAGSHSWLWRNDTAYEKCWKHFEEFLHTRTLQELE